MQGRAGSPYELGGHGAILMISMLFHNFSTAAESGLFGVRTTREPGIERPAFVFRLLYFVVRCWWSQFHIVCTAVIERVCCM